MPMKHTLWIVAVLMAGTLGSLQMLREEVAGSKHIVFKCQFYKRQNLIFWKSSWCNFKERIYVGNELCRKEF